MAALNITSDEEPDDSQLGGAVTDPYDAPSYDQLRNTK